MTYLFILSSSIFGHKLDKRFFSFFSLPILLNWVEQNYVIRLSTSKQNVTTVKSWISGVRRWSCTTLLSVYLTRSKQLMTWCIKNCCFATTRHPNFIRILSKEHCVNIVKRDLILKRYGIKLGCVDQ